MKIKLTNEVKDMKEYTITLKDEGQKLIFKVFSKTMKETSWVKVYWIIDDMGFIVKEDYISDFDTMINDLDRTEKYLLQIFEERTCEAVHSLSNLLKMMIN